MVLTRMLNAALEERPEPFGTSDAVTASKPPMLRPVCVKRSAMPRTSASLAFSSVASGDRWSSDTHSGVYPCEWIRTMLSILGATTARVSIVTVAASTRPSWWSVWLPPISLRPGAENKTASSLSPNALSNALISAAYFCFCVFSASP